MESKISCPKCGHFFKAEDALAHEIEERVKVQLQTHIKLKESDLKEKEEKLRGFQNKLLKEREEFQVKHLKEKEEQRILFENQLIFEKNKLSEEIKKRAKEELELEFKSLQEEIEVKRKENRELRTKELELLKREKELKDKEELLHIEQEKKIIEKCNEVEKELRMKFEEGSHMKLKEKDMQLDALRKQIDEMKRKAEQGSMQLQGEAQEVVLEELLKSIFQFDLIEEVEKGVRGADIIQIVKNNTGKECGKIIYESKRTKAFSESWIDKLKTDLRSQKADIAVIVTECMPKGMERFGLKDGIWICSFQEVKGVSIILRDTLIKIFDIKLAQENKGDKMQLLYDYLTNNEFLHQFQAIVEGFTSMRIALENEKKVTFKLWKEREKQLEKVLQNSAEIYGSIKGIAGKAVGEIKQLEHQHLLLDSNEE